ncbi:hypothetical protein UA08_02703 [Talaromyces atroroseus]|uniref:Zn(2)-C6 fungal-type domain-containing protein n=1 Tax=Talaromyces atroroseus TaxID=1441469 RepID=A0A225B7U8_TALAT|nr:hypothetical protein UA08_02703 [Talaromyces atroroseus]OKL62007.1 hypothetical protein UA08_02703 [Talaromyces atroroseus]
MAEPAARAESSCRRCHRRKKRCDKTLPQCKACQKANQRCSYLDDEKETATFSIAYVHGLELRVKELEQQLAICLDIQTTENGKLPHDFHEATLLYNTTPPDQSSASAISSPPQMQAGTTTQQSMVNVSPTRQRSPNTRRSESLANELKLLSLEAAAERHVGSSSGISFAKLTQAVLRRLSPDRQEFVFEDGLHEGQEDSDLGLENGSTPTFTSAFTEINTHLVPSPLPQHHQYSYAPNDQPDDDLQDLQDLTLLEMPHISHLLEFYFAHSHTLYPIVPQQELTNVLWRLYANPSDALGDSPLWRFRIWMVLAIGSTAYSSVSLLDESESVQLFNKAMVHFEAAMGCGDLAALEVLMLQVSYSFFNKIGPNTWILIGMAARIATGMGLHSADQYKSLAVDIIEHQKRLFFSLYMMDRVVSLALGRPFAIQDDDITVEPFADADDENIRPDGIIPSTKLEPSTMAIPLHILALRTIASEIGSRVHSVKNREPVLRVLAEASSMAIRQAITMHRQQRFSYNWLNLAVLFNATLSLMYSTTAQPNNLSQVLESSKAIEDLELSIELLHAFSRKFASAKRIQSMVQIVLAKLRMQIVHLVA